MPKLKNLISISQIVKFSILRGIVSFTGYKNSQISMYSLKLDSGADFVTLCFMTDFTKLEAACQKKQLEKHYLTVKRVPISNCIIVSGFSEDISDSTLEFYFENEKRSGGGTITDIKVNHEDCTCLVYFEDHTGRLFAFIPHLFDFKNNVESITISSLQWGISS